QLADGSSGLDAVNELLGSFEVPVIFITAYPERFLTGQRPEPAFLIAKPFQVAVVSAVVSQALFFGRKARQRERKPSERQATLELPRKDRHTPDLRRVANGGHIQARPVAGWTAPCLGDMAALNKKLGRSRSAYRLRPTLNGQARGEGERMAVRHDKCRAPCLFLAPRRVAGLGVPCGIDPPSSQITMAGGGSRPGAGSVHGRGVVRV